MARDLAIDLGTRSTQVYERRQGLVSEGPTVVAVDIRSGEVVDIGRSALNRCSQEPSVYELLWPMQNGTAGDPVALQKFVSRLLRPLRGGFFERMRLIITVPSKIGPTERRVISEAGKNSGAVSVYLLPSAIASALGADLPLHEPLGTMVVDIGAGSSEAALLTLGSVVAVSTVQFGSSNVNESIRNSLRRSYRMLITDPAAEELKLAIAESPGVVAPVEASGVTIVDGHSMTAIIERSEVRTAFEELFSAVSGAVRGAFATAPPELAQDVLTRGMFLVGGGARTSGLAAHLSAEFGMPVHVTAMPEHTTGLGAAKCLEALDSLRDVFLGDYD